MAAPQNVYTRPPSSWPRHRAKAKQRAKERAVIARRAQAERDAKRGEAA